MKELRKMVLAAALDCCIRNDCSNCPVLGTICDESDVVYGYVPVQLLGAVMHELAEGQEQTPVQ